MSDPAACRLYLITPPVINDLPKLVESFKAALSGGDVACIQLRLKTPDGVVAQDHEIENVADALLPIAKMREVAFLLNDNPALAKKIGADGVHVGQSDTSVTEARLILGDDATVGVTCHNSMDLGFEAGEAGADYVAFGAFFPTNTKVTSSHAHPETLARWSQMTTVPCVAIGGISPKNCCDLVRAGADFLAVSNSVWAHPQGPAAAVKAFNANIADALSNRGL